MSRLFVGKTIIYCKTRKDTEKLAERLTCDGGVMFYHAGLYADERVRIQDDFAKGKYRVIVATLAFGMGIDIPNITTIIHYGLPKDIESYCQEIGRAARTPDIEANCYLLWGKGDMIVNKSFINNITDPQEKDYQQRKSYGINNYVNNTHVCRMTFMSKYFDPDSNPNTCNKCDICCNYTTRIKNVVRLV